MPYFVYKITPPKQLEQMDHFESYKEARSMSRNQRAELAQNSEVQIRMIHARNNAEAEKLLSAPREQRYIDEG